MTSAPRMPMFGISALASATALRASLPNCTHGLTIPRRGPGPAGLRKALCTSGARKKRKGEKAGLDDIPHDLVYTRPPTTLLSNGDPFYHVKALRRGVLLLRCSFIRVLCSYGDEGLGHQENPLIFCGFLLQRGMCLSATSGANLR